MANRDNYWLKKAHISRRGLLGGMVAAGTGVASLTLVGCGDDDGGPSATDLGIAPRSSGTTVAPVDPFAGAKKGGTWVTSITSDPPTLDVYINPATNTKMFAAYVYSRLFKYKGGPGIRATEAKPTGDLALSAESTPDGLTWTVKLKPNAKFHNVAPVNGRAVTSDDVKFSWERATGETGLNRALFEFVEKIAYPDPQTIVFTLGVPNVAFIEVLCDANMLWIQPREADGRFDPRKVGIGSGPFIFDKYTPSTSITFKRNPDWYETGFPLLDGVEIAIIPEYANIKAQFQAGGLDTFAPNAVDIVDLKKQFPDMQLSGDIAVSLYQFYFDGDSAAPWRDERVRLAMSQALDRDAIADLAYNITKLRAGGVDVKAPWQNILPAGFTRFWLDPKSKDHGETGQYFNYDVANAKKLLSAAGYPDGFSATFQYTGNGYGGLHNTVAEASANFLNQIGIKTVTDVQDYNSKYYTQTYRGNFKGIAFGPETSFNEAGSYPMRQFTPNALNKSRTEDPKLASLARAQQREPDPEKRKELFWEIQRYHAGKMYLVPNQLGGGTAWSAHQSWLKNAVNFVTPVSYVTGAENVPYFWKDK